MPEIDVAAEIFAVGVFGITELVAAAYLAPPGAVKERPVGTASDDLLAPETVAHLKEPQ